jgi:hypothetical protein
MSDQIKLTPERYDQENSTLKRCLALKTIEIQSLTLKLEKAREALAIITILSDKNNLIEAIAIAKQALKEIGK